MNNTEQKRQQSARKSLEFYAFWLWHYITARPDFFETFEQFIAKQKNDVLALCKSKRCKKANVKCKSCKLYTHHQKIDYVGRIYFPWTKMFSGVHSLSVDAISIRMSSSEILQATYENNGEFFNSPVGLHLALMPTTIEGLNLEVRKGKIGSPRLYSAKPKIDLNAPTCLINSDMQRLKTYIEYLEKSNEKHSKELYMCEIALT